MAGEEVSMTKRRPVRVEYTRTVYYGHGRRPHAKKWSWPLLGAGVLVLLLISKSPLLALLIGVGVYYWWRKKRG